MENGSDLSGDASSTHSSIFLQKPYSIGEYYIITADDWPNLSGSSNKGVNYSEINVHLNDGLGKVTSKNNLLVKYSAEKIAITKHRNGTYFWVAIPECFTSNLHIFLITENGFEKKYTFTNLFPLLESSWGQIKFSPDGRHLALTWPQPGNSQLSDVMVLDFNNTSGLVNPSQVITGGNGLYGVEFSTNSKYLYLSTWLDKNKVCQCPVVQGTTDYLTGCKFYPQHNVSGQLQLGPDERIYIANSSKGYLGVIQFPDSDFVKSGFIDSAITLLPNTKCYAGLPAIYVTNERLSAGNICLNDTGRFSVSTNNLKYDSIRWYIDHSQLPDTTANASSVFTQTGIYDITAVLFSQTRIDTFSRSIMVKPLPPDPGIHDTAVCTGQTAVLDAYRVPGAFYQWNTGSTDSVLSTSKTGSYDVKITLNGCSITNSFTLGNKPYPVVSLPKETVICEGSVTSISAFQSDLTYLWSTGDTNSSVMISNKQEYWVAVTRDGCTTTDSFNLVTTILPDTHLGNDTTICVEQPFQLNVTYPYSTYLWNTGFTQPVMDIINPGRYSVQVTNPCGTAADTIEITQQVCNCHVWTPNSFTPNGDHTNDLFVPVVSCDYTLFDFRIFNRWGQEVFRSDSPAKAWNGQYNNETMPADVFTWKLTCTLVNSAGKTFEQNVNGTVTLIR